MLGRVGSAPGVVVQDSCGLDLAGVVVLLPQREEEGVLALRLLDATAIGRLPPQALLPQRNDIIRRKIPDFELIKLVKLLLFTII